MATYTLASADIRINDNTRFRAWVQFVSDSLTSIGWAKTADSGQIDPATVTAPGGASTAQGYEIRTSPSETGLTQNYFKIEYGSGQLGAYCKALWLTIGTGSDGAGTITGIFFARKQVSSATAYSGGSVTPGDDWVSGGTGVFRIIATQDGASTTTDYGFALVVQRAHDRSGTNSDHGWFVSWGGTDTSTRPAYEFWPTGANGVAVQQDGLSSVRGTRIVGDSTYTPAWPVLHVHPVYGPVVSKNMLAVPSNLVTHQAAVTIGGVPYIVAWGGTSYSGTAGWGWTVPSPYLTLLVRND